ncbi:MAG: hypothetical protein OXG08_13990 [Gammaproteobacteria bacterium]|nr:hypothetical protein [Gammaproteobacteria bacterium]
MKFARSRIVSLASLSFAFFLGIGVGALVSWLLGSYGTQDLPTNVDAAIPINSTDSQARKENSVATAAIASHLNSLTVRSLEELKQIESPYDRSLALRNTLVGLDIEQSLNLLDKSLNLPVGSSRDEMQSAIIQRLAQVSPKTALSRALELNARISNQLVSRVYVEWAHSDLNGAVLAALPLDQKSKESALNAILNERTDLPAEALRAIARDLGNEQMAIRLIAQREIEDALTKPEEKWDELVAKFQDDSQNSWDLARVAKSWVKTNGLSALDQIATAITNLQTRAEVLRSVLRSVAETDPLAAFEYALNSENDPSDSIVFSVTSVWAQSDPRAALAAVSAIDDNSRRHQLEESIVLLWATEEPIEVLDGIGSLPATHQVLATVEAVSAIAWISPQNASMKVTELTPGAAKARAASMVVAVWSLEDPKKALDWILNEPSVEDLRTQLLATNIPELVKVDPELAMSTALALPLADGEKIESLVIHALAVNDVDSTIKFLPQLRTEGSRSLAYQSIGQSLVNTGRFEEVVSFAYEEVPDAHLADYFSSIVDSWARQDSVELLRSMDRLPSGSIRSKAASAILSQERSSLTANQLERTRQFLTAQDANSHE